MPEFDDDYGFENEEPDNSPAGLRKAYEAQKKALKAAEDARKKAEQELSQYRVGDVLNERGVTDARAKALLTKSGVDLTKPEAIDEWLTEFGDLFGYQRQEAPPEEVRAEAAAISRMNQSERLGQPDNNLQDVTAKIQNLHGPELDAYLRSLGNLKL